MFRDIRRVQNGRVELNNRYGSISSNFHVARLTFLYRQVKLYKPPQNTTRTLFTRHFVFFLILLPPNSLGVGPTLVHTIRNARSTAFSSSIPALLPRIHHGWITSHYLIVDLPLPSTSVTFTATPVSSP